MLLFLINLFVLQAKAYPDISCIEWFEKSKISKKSNDCESNCSVLMVDMGPGLEIPTEPK